jgi:cellular nucleic acid-binding protein
MSRDCTQGAKCYNCKCLHCSLLPKPIANILIGGELGHISKDCPSEMSQERVCYRCKQPGHLQADCPA